MKIGIGGPRGTRWKNHEQEVLAKTYIRRLLKTYAAGIKPTIIPEDGYNYASPAAFGISETFLGELIVVSGHCPIGKERWYCLSCDEWFDDIKAHPHGHNIVKAYDAGGVDTWTELEAYRQSIKLELHRAPAKSWDDVWECCICGAIANSKRTLSEKCRTTHMLGMTDKELQPFRIKGYKSRNLDMAEVCTVWYDIEFKGSCTGRGGCGGTGYREIPHRFGASVLTHRNTCPKCLGDGCYSGATLVHNTRIKNGLESYKIVIR